MAELLEAQQAGDMVGDSSRLRLEDAKVIPYPADSFPGHAAWLDWPWKLHRIQSKTGDLRWELYNLDEDPGETTNQWGLAPEKALDMQLGLEAWQLSVLSSLNGEDY
jgi:hypothetical protein